MKNLYAGLIGGVRSKRVQCELFVIFVFSICFCGPITYPDFPSVTFLQGVLVIPTIKEEVTSLAPLMGMMSLFALIWLFYTRRIYPNKHPKIVLPEGASIDAQIDAAYLNYARACSGTIADHVWFLGLLTYGLGVLVYGFWRWLEIFPS